MFYKGGAFIIAFTQRISQSCLNHSQEPCEWADADLEVLGVESEQILYLKVGFRISALSQVRPFTLPTVRQGDLDLQGDYDNALRLT